MAVKTDPTGQLKEGQIYFRSAQSLTDPETGSVFTTILGPVIVNALTCVYMQYLSLTSHKVGRNPTLLPSDLQLVSSILETHAI